DYDRALCASRQLGSFGCIAEYNCRHFGGSSRTVSVRSVLFCFSLRRVSFRGRYGGRKTYACSANRPRLCFSMESTLATMAATSPSKRRLQKELMSLIREPPPGVHVDAELAGQNLTQWIVHMEGAKGTLYEGEQFQLQFKFSSKYPFDSPEVTFIGENIPVHPHVYSNGHICLSILTEDWSPALSVQSICLSIISMLSSCKEKKRPPDNTFYVKTCNKNPKKTKWWYHGKKNCFILHISESSIFIILLNPCPI
ncbi:UBE2W enzyme, partial [Acromyrmex insinuator]